MRVWDVDPALLCRAHLLGEHRELHAVFSVIANGREGYSRHPEVRRWRGRLPALARRHDALVAEMRRRGWTGHKTDLPPCGGEAEQSELLDSVEDQIAILRAKPCGCTLDAGAK